MTPRPGKHFWQGNQASVEGALVVGCRFFAGYPITPATEFSELMARRMPACGGLFVQGEDELASLAMVIGASHAGLKAMTATSGPGISLMAEEIGYAALTETPCVIVDCQRVGTGTGIATKSQQGDVYQVRFNSHGDYSIIALAPNSPQEMFDLTIKAFNLAETYRVPVFVLSDEIISHMRENVTVPPLEEVEVAERRRPSVPSHEFIPYAVEDDTSVPPMPALGQGYGIGVSGFVHTETGSPSTAYDVCRDFITRLWNKVEKRAAEIALLESQNLEGAQAAVVSYGSVSRSAMRAVRDLRAEGHRVGGLRLVTLWPFPDEDILRLAESVDVIMVPEMNMGKMVREVQRASQGKARVISFPKPGVDLHTPGEIAGLVREVIS